MTQTETHTHLFAFFPAATGGRTQSDAEPS